MKVSLFSFLILGHYASAFVPNSRGTLTAKTSSLFAATDSTATNVKKRINLKIDLDSPKVATQDTVCRGDKNVYCRCWLSGTFPNCDGTHMKHNKATGDNVGPLIVSVPKGDAKESETEKETSADDAKLAGRKKRLIIGYKAISVSYLALVVMKATMLAKNGLSPALIPSLVSGHALVAGVSTIMASAAENDRLKSDTYKRLNLAMLGYALLSLKVLSLTDAPKYVILPFAISIVNTIKGYTYGVLGWDKKNMDTSLGKDFLSGFVSTPKGLFSIPTNLKSLGYLSAFSLFARQAVVKLLSLKATDGGAAMIKPLTQFGRMVFFLSILYTLKDAADRDRLKGTTFVQLNYMSALFMATNTIMVAATVGSIPSLIPAAYTVFFALNGVSSFFERQKV